ncbi:MAG: hypothetical protein N2235_02970 [Fischerella sp.]|nr:hypothetical protein [Fischerella sp.]
MNINSIQEYSRRSFEFQTSKRLIYEKLGQNLTIAYSYKNDSGLFKADPELIAFLSSFDDIEMILEDLYNNPVLVNRSELLDIAKKTYKLATNTWYTEFNNLKQVKNLNDL